MKKLVIVRSGQSEDHGKLTVTGFSQTAELASRLRTTHLYTNSLVMISSPASPAWETAGIMAKITLKEAEKSDLLLIDADHPEDSRSLLAMLQARWDEADVFLLVTDGDYTESFPGYFGSHCLGESWGPFAIANSEAWVIDCAEKKIDYIHLW